MMNSHLNTRGESVSVCGAGGWEGLDGKGLGS